MKRLVDVIVACVALLFASPVMAVTAILIKLEDGGPILHRRRCVGVGGGDFDAFKFRSMCVNADAVLLKDARLRQEFEANYKLQNDPRITRLGRFIRKASIDELPQLFNVLRGEMSVVGPRMVTRAELAKYGQFADLLLSVKPGITGYWQTQGRQKKSYDERVRMDVFYIQHRSFWLDLRILFYTPLKVVRGEGAY